MSSKPIGGTKDDGVPAVDAARKKVYEKPSFVREQVFETMALACGKTNPTAAPASRTRRIPDVSLTRSQSDAVAKTAPALIAEVLQRFGEARVRALGTSMLPAIGPHDVLLVQQC